MQGGFEIRLEPMGYFYLGSNQRSEHCIQSQRVRRYWEIIADKLSKAGWSFGWVSAVDSEGRTIWIVDAHRDNGKRFVVRSDELLTAFLELERITHELAVSALLRDDNV